MNTIREAYTACAAAKATGREVVVSFICNTKGDLYGGESLQQAVKTLAELNPAAFSINCASPRHLNPPLHILRTQTALPICVYGNIGIPESEQHGWEFTRDIAEDQYAIYAKEWHRNGAAIIGGCCGTTPEYIRSVALSIGK